MNTYDLTPLFRTTIGFDRLTRILDAAGSSPTATSTLPPYDILMDGEDRYRITMSVAGFSRSDLTIQTRENMLTIEGKKDNEEEASVEFLHRGIAARDFRTEFQLADHVEVTGANLVDGLLTIDLVRNVPEEKRAKTVEIRTSAPQSLIGKAKKLLSDGSKKAA